MCALALSACMTVGEDFVSPQTGPTSAGYAMAGDAAPPGVVLGSAAAGPWWMSFGSAELDGVIRQALANSPSLGDDLQDGGAAMTAYARLQYQALPDTERAAIEAALLRYCELDTLAMVMAVQAWQAEVTETTTKA